MSEILQELIIHGGKVLLVVVVLLTTVAYLVLAERKFAGFIQDRIGPNRVGPAGVFQPLADLMKFIFKEDLTPGHVHKFFYALAPVLAMAPALIAFAVIPFGIPLPWKPWGREISMLVADLDIGILFVFAITSLGVYGITLGGWASNSKYALFGGIRSAAQMVSYEITIGLAVISVFMFTGTLNLNEVVGHQAQYGWFIWRQPLAFLLFFVSIFAETNRLPFDLPEAETELAAGFHTEYSAMKFALFFLGEYAAMILGAALTTTLFLGGWSVPFGLIDLDPSNPTWGTWIISIASFSIKTGFLLFIFIWVRWTLPRFRYDQLMRLGWQVMLPLALLNIVVYAVLKVVF